MTDTLISDTVTSIAPLEVREQFMTDPRPRCRQLPGLRDGREPAPVGAVRLQSHLDHRGQVGSGGNSLEGIWCG
ncbi:MAG: hypothetical protein R2734_08145 [Nocardioides sp.]